MKMRPWSEVETHIQWADVIYFDYGGITMGYGTQPFLDYWNRNFIKSIKEYPSKSWYCWSLMKTFDNEDMAMLKNMGVVFEKEHFYA
jgi:hypothetical protein